MSTRLARQIVFLHSDVPLIAVILASLTSFVLIVLHALGWQVWLMMILILLAWLPVFTIITRSLYRRDRWIAFFFVLLISQSVHFIEHIAQMAQIHIMGLSGTQAHGLIGQLDLEWVHFLFDACWVLVCVYILFFLYHKTNPWLWPLIILASWHAIEHVAIIHYYITTGIVGSPGLLAQGGAIGGGLPITRPDLHFLYNLAEEILIIVAYIHQVRRLPAAASDEVGSAQVRVEVA